MEKIKILLIEDEEFDVRRVLKTVELQSDQLEINKIVSDGNSAVELLKTDPNFFDIVIMDFQIAGGLMGEDLINEIKKINPSLQIIMITKLTINDNKFEFASKLLKIGAFWYCTKYPTHITDYIYQPTDFLISIHNAFQKKLLEAQKAEYDKKMFGNIEMIMESKKIIGSSKQIIDLKEAIKKYASRDVNVLIYGESGTGKELVAFNIHYNSNRKFENFVRINCGSIPSELVESELFGYEKYAFTGANKDKKGLFELANKGTIFLDEISNLPLNSQAKLLRVLQEGEIEKIGRIQTLKVDFRLIAASNKNLEEEVREKRFREDLFYRLNIIPINIAPLRERKEDIIQLLNFYLLRYSNSLKFDKPIFSDEALEILLNYSWPGNVRQLKSFVQRILFVDADTITGDMVVQSIGGIGQKTKNDEDSLDFYFDNNKIISLNEFERLARTKYVQFVRDNSSSDSQAAQKLGIAQPNFSRLCRDLHLK